MSTKLKEIWLVLRREGFFFFGGGGCLQFRRGELGWERRRRNKGGEGQQSGDIIHFCRWNHRRTPSVDDFVYNSNGELVMSLYVGPNLNPLVTPLVKSPAKTSTSANHIFFKKKLIYFVCNSGGRYRLKYRRNSICRYLSPQCTRQNYFVGFRRIFCNACMTHFLFWSLLF